MSLADLFSTENKEKFARKEAHFSALPEEVAPKKKRTHSAHPGESSKGNPKKQRTMSRKELRMQREQANKDKDAELFSLGSAAGSEEALAADDMDLGIDGEGAKESVAEIISSAKEDTSKRTIFAGNIPLTETVKSLTKYFTTHYGEVESVRLRSVPIAGVKVEEKGNSNLVKKVCTNARKFGEQKGSFNAYVVFKSATVAAEAVRNQRSNNKGGIIMGGRHVRLDTTNPPTLFDPKRSVFLGSLPVFVDEEKVREHFAKKLPNGQDDIEAVRLVRDPETLLGKGIGYILFTSRECVLHALEMHDSSLGKRKIRVSACGKRTKNTEYRKGANKPQQQGSSSEEATKSSSSAHKAAAVNNDEPFPRDGAADGYDESRLTAKAAAATMAISRRPDTTAKLAFNAANALKRIKTKMGTGSGSGASRKKVLVHNKQANAKEDKGRKGKRLGGVVKRAMKAAKAKKSPGMGAGGDKKKKKPV